MKNFKTTLKVIIATTLSYQSISFAKLQKNGLLDLSESIYPTINEQIKNQVQSRFYISVPENRWMNMTESIKPIGTDYQAAEPVIALRYRMEEKSVNKSLKTGLRIFGVNNGNGSTQQRYKIAETLAKSGVVQTGDIILTYRPYWAETIKYAHIQMGVSHAGMAYVSGSTVYNLDMPLNDEMFDAAGVNKMSSSHYMDQNGMYVHILRPRINSTQQANLREWAKLSVQNTKKVYKSKITFNTNYDAPIYNAQKPNDLNFVKNVAKLALGKAPSESFGMYCSEFIWSIHSLRDCNPAQLQNSSTLDQDLNACIKKIYEPMNVLSQNMAGLGEGPRALVSAIKETDPSLTQEDEFKLLQSVFTSASAVPPTEKIMSQGHKDVDKMLTDMKFYDGLMGYYLNPDPNFRAQMMTVINPSQKANYSPTSMIINAVLPSQQRVYDYVGTVVFLPQTTYTSLKTMAEKL